MGIMDGSKSIDPEILARHIEELKREETEEGIKETLSEFKVTKADPSASFLDLKNRIINAAKAGLAIQKIKEEVDEKIKDLNMDNAGYLLALWTFSGEKDTDDVTIPQEYKKLFTDIGRRNINKGTYIYHLYPAVLNFSFQIKASMIFIYTPSERYKKNITSKLLDNDFESVLESISNYLGNSTKIIQSLNKSITDVKVDDLIQEHQSKDESLNDREYSVELYSDIVSEALKAKNNTVKMYMQGSQVALKLLGVLENALKE